ncbi:MAG: glycosyltransferase [Actinomycetes bacterium]|jgi:GT2 family glycosyltransferase
MSVPFKVYKRIGDLRKLSAKDFSTTILIYADSFIADSKISIEAAKANSAPDVAIYLLISGQPELGDIASVIDERTYIVQITEGAGWGEAMNALIKLANSPYVVVMDPSTIFTGDAITPTIAKLAEKEFSAVGWRGGLVNVEDEWRSVDDKGEGEVDVLFSYFLGLNKDHALEAGAFNIRAIYYRNADMEFGLKLRQAQGRLWQLDLPLKQERHHGYYDTDPTYRDEQSKKNYDRILARFRGKNEILSPRR